MFTWFGEIVEFVKPLLADVELHQTGLFLGQMHELLHFASSVDDLVVVFPVKQDVRLGGLHLRRIDVRNRGIVELVPFKVVGIQSVRGVVTSASAAVMADDPRQIVRTFLEEEIV